MIRILYYNKLKIFYYYVVFTYAVHVEVECDETATYELELTEFASPVTVFNQVSLISSALVFNSAYFILFENVADLITV